MEARRKSYQDLSGLKSQHKPVSTNFLLASKSRALKGFKLVQNLPFQSRVWLLLVAFVLFTTAFWFTISFSSEQSSESRHHIRKPSQPREVSELAINTAVLYLQRPQRPFHGNHWYHIGEYYVSRHEIIQQLLSEQKSQGRNIRHLKLIAHDYRLSNVMTKMSFALIVLSCLKHSESGGNIQTIELFEARALQYHAPDTNTYALGDITNSSILTTIEHKQPLFGYYNLPLEGPKFVNFARTKASSIDRNALFSNTIEEFAPVHIASSALNWVYYFNPPPLSVYCRNKLCREVVYLGPVGAKPIPPVDWFGSGGDADNFRLSAWAMCGIQNSVERASVSASASAGPSASSIVRDSHSVHSATDTHNIHNTHATDSTDTIHAEPTASTIPTKRVYNLVVYQRDLNRRFVHLKQVVETLRSRTHTATSNTYTDTNTDSANTNSDTDPSNNNNAVWNIEILRHKEDADPCVLINTLSTADILLTAHGFQSTALMFMRPGSVIIEIFPYKYHRTTYLPLSRVFGLHYRSIQNTAPNTHSGSNMFTNLVSTIDANTPSTQLLRVISQGACMRDLQCRSYARSRDISMPSSHIELVLRTMDEVAAGSLDPYAPLLN